MCETTDLILKMAHEGKSKLEVRRALGGIGRITFNHMLELIGPVKFYKGPTHTVRGFHGTVLEIIAHFKLRTSRHVVCKRIALGYDIEDCFFVAKYGKVMTVRGFTGSTLEIIKHFNIDITADRVSKRIKRGKSLEEAFFSPIEIVQVRNMEPSLRVKRQEELRAAYSQSLFG